MGIGWRVRPWMTAAAAVGTALSLLAPWARSGQVDRSTIDLLSSAGALDQLEGRAELVALSAWFCIPLLAAVSAVSAGWGQRRMTAWSALPMGPMMLAAWWTVSASPLDARWGAALAAAMGVTASWFGALLLMTQGDSTERVR